MPPTKTDLSKVPQHINNKDVPENLKNVPQHISTSNNPEDKYYSNEGIVNKGINYERPDLLGSITFDQNQRDIEDQKGLNQSFTETSVNNLATFGIKSVSSFIGGAGYLMGTAKAIGKSIDPTQDAKISDITENPLVEFSETMDSFAEKTFPNYESQDESENPYAWRNFFDTVANQGIRDAAPFLLGMYAEGAVIGKIVSTPFKIAQARKIASLNGELAGKASEFSKLLQKAPPQVTQLVVNNGEAMMEASNTSDEVYKKSYDDSISKGLDEDQSKEIATTAQNEAFKNIYLLNMAILKINNLSTRSFFKSDLGSRRVYKQALEDFGKLTTKTAKAKYIARKAWDYAADPVKESAEELLQGGASTAVKNNISNNPNVDGNISTGELFNNALDTLSETVKRAGTGEGAAEIVISSILSGPISIRQRYNNSKNERINAENRKKTLESSIKSDYEKIEGLVEQDPTDHLKQVLTPKGHELIDSARTYNDFENVKKAAVTLDDKALYQIARDTQIANMAFGHFESGMGEVLDTKIKDLSNEISNELKQQGKNTIEDFATGKNISIEEYTADLKIKIKSYEDVYNILESQYNISNPTLRQSAFNNAINQKELKERINKAKPIIGETWLNHRVDNVHKDVLSQDAIASINKELSSLSGKTDIASITKSIQLSSLLDSHKSLKDFNDKVTDVEIQENYKNFKSNKSNKSYYDALKEQFKILTNPELAQEYIDAKIKEDEEKTNNVVNNNTPDPQNTSQNNNSTTNNTTLPSSKEGSNNGSNNVSSTSSENTQQDDTLERGEENDYKISEINRKTREENELRELEKKEKESEENKEKNKTPENVFDGFDIEDQARQYEEALGGTPDYVDSNETHDNNTPDPKQKSIVNSTKDLVEKTIENNNKVKEEEKQEVIRVDSIPLFITNRFEDQKDGFIEIDPITKETKLENKQALEELLKLKKGDKLDAQLGFYENGKFLTYNESKEKSTKTLAIRLFKNGIKLGAIKHNQDQDIKDIFDNIQSNPELHNHILTSELEVSGKWAGFIRNLIDNKDNKIEKDYKEIPFEERAYINSPIDVVGSEDFIIVTITNDGNLITNQYNIKALKHLGLTTSNKLYEAFNKTKLRPGVMYTLIKSPDGSIIPIASHGEYISHVNKEYIILQVKEAISNKDIDLKELKNNISDYIYYDRTKGLYISSGKIYYKGAEIGLKGLLDLFEKQDIYKPIDLKTKSNKTLNTLLKLNIPKASSIQFINPKVTLDLSPLKSIGNIIQESSDSETNDSIITDNIVDLPIRINNEVKKDFTESVSDFDNISDETVSEYTQNLYSNIDLNEDNEILDPISKEQVIDELLSKYNKTREELSIKNISNINNKELLEQIIKCL